MGKVYRYVSDDKWFKIENAPEILIQYGDVIHISGNEIHVGNVYCNFSSSIKTEVQKSVQFIKALELQDYFDFYHEDLQKRNPDAPVFCEVDKTQNALKSPKALEVASRFNVTFGK